MSRPIYGINERPPPCVYTLPPEQNVQIYLRQLNNILQQFQQPPNTELTIERLQTLNALMRAVKVAATAPPT